MKDSVSTLMRAWPGLELSIILPGRSSIEEKATDYDWLDRNDVSILYGFSPANRTPTPIDESSRSEED